MALPVVERSAQQYETVDGKVPFKNWLTGLGDARAQAKVTKAVTKAVTQMEAGNFGDHKAIADGEGLQERRIDYGPGYRVYYITEGDELIILFAGSAKSDQQKAINLAKGYLADYRARKRKVAPQTTSTAMAPKPPGKSRRRKRHR